VRGVVAPTDQGWYEFLLGRPELGEVNFWRPGGSGFAALSPGEPFFFKLKSPYHAIGGFGLFARFARLPVWRAWDVFGQANGTRDEWALMRRLERLSGDTRPAGGMNRVIGCVAITEPVFFAPDEWVDPPVDWKPQTQSFASTTSNAVRGCGCGVIVWNARQLSAPRWTGRLRRLTASAPAARS
jgi:putative restriction endonuclease